ncbi:MAG TPA: amidase [Candidatus Binatia bacterium]|nr:amidase [Candidatus Binatia bacterium]
MSDIAFQSATELTAALRAGKLGSRELLDHYWQRVERLNPRINAVVTFDMDRARECADAADAALARGELGGPLHGLPITIKDAIETAGLRTTSGAQAFAAHVPAADAPAVSRLRAAGAVIFGKTNLPTMAMDVQTYNPIFGTTNNPWDLSRSPGGSSGGAAAALAAGLCGLELGSDIGGSIRNPAHYCGVYGHKPTHAIIPQRGHIPPPPGLLSEADIGVLGPLARRADDLDLALSVLAGPDDQRAIAWRLELPPPRRASLREYRVAAWLDDPACPVDAAVLDRFHAGVAALRKAGVRVDEQARPGFTLADADRDYLRLVYPVTTAGLPEKQFERLVGLAATTSSDDSRLARLAHFSTIRHREWLRAHEARERYRAAWAALFRDYDVLLCPIAPTAAIAHDHNPDQNARTIRVNGQERSYWDQLVWAGLVGMALLPATVAPMGRTPSGLPVGIQIVGPYLEDRTPIDFARRLADVVGGFEAPPGY